MEEESVSVSTNGSAAVPDSVATATSDVKLPATLPEISTVAVTTTAIAATVQS